MARCQTSPSTAPKSARREMAFWGSKHDAARCPSQGADETVVGQGWHSPSPYRCRAARSGTPFRRSATRPASSPAPGKGSAVSGRVPALKRLNSPPDRPEVSIFATRPTLQVLRQVMVNAAERPRQERLDILATFGCILQTLQAHATPGGEGKVAPRLRRA